MLSKHIEKEQKLIVEAFTASHSFGKIRLLHLLKKRRMNENLLPCIQRYFQRIPQKRNIVYVCQSDGNNLCDRCFITKSSDGDPRIYSWEEIASDSFL